MEQLGIVVLSLMVFDWVIQGTSTDQMGLCHWLNYSTELFENVISHFSVLTILTSLQALQSIAKSSIISNTEVSIQQCMFKSKNKLY